MDQTDLINAINQSNLLLSDIKLALEALIFIGGVVSAILIVNLFAKAWGKNSWV
jgi:hypothetical protein